MMDHIKTAFAKAVVHTVGALPPRTARKLGRFLGWCAYKANTRMAATTRTNLAVCFPELSAKERSALALRSLKSTGMLATEVCGIYARPKRALPSIVKVTGREQMVADLAVGKGVILLAPHLGNWEVLGWYLPTLAPVTNMYLPAKISGLNEYVRRCRERAGATIVPANAKGVSTTLKALKAGGISGILPDQIPVGEHAGAFAPFFGEPTYTMKLVHKLLQKTGAKAVFAYARRVEHGFEVIFRAAPEAIYSGDMTASLTALNQGIEQLAKEAPEQYQWEYKRFRVRPDGDRYFYDAPPAAPSAQKP